MPPAPVAGRWAYAPHYSGNVFQRKIIFAKKDQNPQEKGRKKAPGGGFWRNKAALAENPAGPGCFRRRLPLYFAAGEIVRRR